MNSADLNPAQARVVSELMDIGAPRPRFERGLAAELRQWLEESLRPVADSLGARRQVFVAKRDLGNVHACESYWKAEKGNFEWSARTAIGTVAHKAIEKWIFAPTDLDPLDAVDGCLADFANDDRRASPGPWLATASALDVAELRARANNAVVAFKESWPRIPAAWSPRCETPIYVSLGGDRITLQGKPDLVLGVAKGHEARCLIVDLKTGRSHASHRDDLRFYALLQTLKIGVPPFRVASYYLDGATFTCEDITVEILETAVRRTIDGVIAIARLEDDDAAQGPAISPGPTCAWCSIRDSCPGPAQLVADRDFDQPDQEDLD